jgi:hypothetical protein
MKTVLKALWVDSADVALDSYSPLEADNFSLWLELRIGLASTDSADDFRLFVCTPDWLKINRAPCHWGRHTLVTQAYDLDGIRAEIQKCIDRCSGKSWAETAKNLSRFFAWEFEDFDACSGVHKTSAF